MKIDVIVYVLVSKANSWRDPRQSKRLTLLCDRSLLYQEARACSRIGRPTERV